MFSLFESFKRSRANTSGFSSCIAKGELMGGAFNGKVLHVEGSFNGTIIADTLVIAKGGKVTAHNIVAMHIICRGELVIDHDTALVSLKVEGGTVNAKNITVSQISMDSSSKFNGTLKSGVTEEEIKAETDVITEQEVK